MMGKTSGWMQGCETPTLLSSPSCQEVLDAAKQSKVTRITSSTDNQPPPLGTHSQAHCAITTLLTGDSQPRPLGITAPPTVNHREIAVSPSDTAAPPTVTSQSHLLRYSQTHPLCHHSTAHCDIIRCRWQPQTGPGVGVAGVQVPAPVGSI